MAAANDIYKRLVTDDIAAYTGLIHPVRAGLPERLFIRSLPIGRIHPNPNDEFTHADVGPNHEIVSRYADKWSMLLRHGHAPEIEPLCVEKMSAGDYMLLDGHHRWYAAHRLSLRKLPVHVMNVTPVEKNLGVISSSARHMCVSIDLDEVLLTASPDLADKKLPMSFGHYIGRGMRKNAPLLIRELQALGFDVWVYSSGYMPEDALRKLFRYHGVTVDGIVGGLKNKQVRTAFRKAFTEKYDVSVHIDNSGIICVDTRSKAYDIIDIGAGQTDWGAKSFAAVKAHPIVTAHLQTR